MESAEVNQIWVSVALEEYKSLRAEIQSQFQNRSNVLTFGSAVLGLFVTAAAQTDGNKIGVYFIGAILMPLISSLIILLSGMHSAKIARIGSYLKHREAVVCCRIKNMTEKSVNRCYEYPLYWEHSLRNKKWSDNDEITLASSVVIAFSSISLMCAGYVYYFISQNPHELFYIICQSVSGSVIIVGFLFGVYFVSKIHKIQSKK